MINEPGRFQAKGVAFLGATGLRSRNALMLELRSYLGHYTSLNKRWQLLKLNHSVSREGSGRKEEEEETHGFFSLRLMVMSIRYLVWKSLADTSLRCFLTSIMM